MQHNTSHTAAVLQTLGGVHVIGCLLTPEHLNLCGLVLWPLFVLGMFYWLGLSCGTLGKARRGKKLL